MIKFISNTHHLSTVKCFQTSSSHMPDTTYDEVPLTVMSGATAAQLRHKIFKDCFPEPQVADEDELVILSRRQLRGLVHTHCCKICHQETEVNIHKDHFGAYVNVYCHSYQEDIIKMAPKMETEGWMETMRLLDTMRVFAVKYGINAAKVSLLCQKERGSVLK